MRLLIFTACLFISGNVHGQIRVEHLSLLDTSKADLYCAVLNELRIYGLQIGDSVSFTASRISLRTGDLFSIIPSAGANTDTLLVRRNGAIVYRENYGIKRIEELTAYLGAVHIKTGGRITTRDLTKGEALLVRSGNFRSGISITSFELSMVNNGEYFELGVMTGNLPSVTQQLQLAKLVPGDKVYLENIKVNIDGCTRQLPAIALLTVE